MIPVHFPKNRIFKPHNFNLVGKMQNILKLLFYYYFNTKIYYKYKYNIYI